MEVKQVLLGIFVIIILIVLYNWLFSDKTINNIITLKDATISESIKSSDIEHQANFSYSLWIMIADYNYNYGSRKYILAVPKGTADGDKIKHHYSLYLDSNSSELIFNLGVTGGSAGSTAIEHVPCKVENIPLQRWTHVLVSFRNRAIDMYIDGKLVKTCTTEKTYALPEGPKDVLLCPKNSDVSAATGTADMAGFSGFLGSVRYFTRAVQPREAYAIYKEGYSSGNWLSDLFNKYKLKFSFMEDDKEINSLVL